MERMTFMEADKRYNDPRTSLEDKEALGPKLDEVKNLYPQKLSEAEPNKSN
jgi:hypothetical protein